MYNTHPAFPYVFLETTEIRMHKRTSKFCGKFFAIKDQKEHFTFYSIAAYLLFTIRKNLDVKSMCTYCI